VWGEIARQAQDAEPNAAHRALAHWEQLLDENGGHLEVITQNVDGLHQRAGSRAVTEMHGSILRTRPVGTDDSHVSTATSKRGIDPHRTSFGSPSVRPDIVLFGEVPRGIPHAHRVVGQADLVLFVGTSGLINHVAELLRLANAGPAVTMLLNLEPWDERTTALTGNFDITTLDDALELEVLVPTS
jgi:NAD-dependent deacetylase